MLKNKGAKPEGYLRATFEMQAKHSKEFPSSVTLFSKDG